jgi:hypothetical protein
VSTTLEGKGLEGTPVAEKHTSRRTGKPYWRYRNAAGRFVSKKTVEQLGFAWWPRQDNPTRGMLKRVGGPKAGKTIKFEEAKKRLTEYGSIVADSDVANLDDLSETGGELPPIAEDDEESARPL